jgi:membrane-bound ClpP family serine protease
MISIIIVFLLLLGIFFLIVELFFIPGITLAGAAALVSYVAAVYLAFTQINAVSGTMTLIVAVILSGLAIWLFLRSRTLDKMALTTDIDGKIEPLKGLDIKVGDTGHTVSRLAPMGKVKIGDNVIEAKTQGEFLDHNTEIVVCEVFTTNVLVEKKGIVKQV